MGLISVVPVMSIMNSFMNDVFEKIATESSAPAHQNGVRVELWVHTASGPLTVYYPACIDEIPHSFGLDTVLDLATRRAVKLHILYTVTDCTSTSKRRPR